MRRVLHLAAAACAASLFAPAARAESPSSLMVVSPSGAPASTSGPDLDVPSTRRGGFMIGAFYGAGLASSAGYPNDQNFIGDPDYYSASGLMLGSGGSGFLMGALTDYLSFGFWFGAATFNNPTWHSIGEGGGLRLELFPLFGLGGVLRDLGAFTQVGIGGTELVYRDKPGVSSDGVGSSLGAGVFYELRLTKAGRGHLALGPSLEYDTVFSQAIERHGALLGARMVWYLGK
jgi:hypothetical protein